MLSLTVTPQYPSLQNRTVASVKGVLIVVHDASIGTLLPYLSSFPLRLPLFQPHRSHIPPHSSISRGFSLGLALTVGITSNASRCAWAWTWQGRFGRKEPSRGSCYPSWSRFNILLCETEDCHLSAKSAHCRPCQYRYVISLYCFLPLVLTVSLSSTCVTACRSRHRPPPLSRPVTTPNRFVTVRLRRHVPCPSPSIAPSSRHHPPPSLRVVTACNRFVTVHLRRTCPTIAPSSGAAPRSALYLQFSTYFEYSRSRAFIIK